MTLWNNLRYAARQLGKTPAFTLTILATLGLCIGANTAIYSVVDAVFFRPLPYPDPDRLVMIARVYQHNGSSGTDAGQTGKFGSSCAITPLFWAITYLTHKQFTILRALALGIEIKRTADYWFAPSAIGVSSMSREAAEQLLESQLIVVSGSAGDSQSVHITEKGNRVLGDALNEVIEQGQEYIQQRLPTH